ncbi:zinc finger BED domain-containing protein [Lachancea lanzarotensis]|uniref:LALA0S07e04456g1_1 n=1 Tax=Lachancea lanzarotensis TaxID=1245769 RepID=A0A0C7NC69_9SACH|nr:putative transposase of the Rover hAT-like DNA transposon [Lachancea lanzarotensis]CEP63189.1 putative transposase of the Rover hAT-like DNA transposon [Lachancea lanzarotensis]
MSNQVAISSKIQAQESASDYEAEAVNLRNGSKDDQHDVTTTESKSKESKWMARSGIRNHFEISVQNGIKVATCTHCGKTFQESKSTGNLVKHVKKLHPAEFNTRKTKEPKGRILDVFDLRSSSTQLPEPLVFEMEHNPGAFTMVALVIEKLLPFSFVNAYALKWLGDLLPEMSFFRSETAVRDKLETYSTWLDEGLITSLQGTGFVNLELDVWTDGDERSYLSIFASFAPNLSDEQPNALGTEATHNKFNEPFQSHLLDLVDVSGSPQTAEYLYEITSSVIKKFKIVGKIRSITSDNGASNILRHSDMLCDLMKLSRPETSMKTKHLYHVNCARHILNALLRTIGQTMKENEKFHNGLQHITKLTRILKKSSLLRDSLAVAGLPEIPPALESSWVSVWDQIAKYLDHYDAYLKWFESFQESSKHRNIAARMAPHLQLSSETREVLEYFVDCCSIFKYLHDSLQNETFNQLPNAISFYYTLKEYFDLCSNADVESIIPSSEGCFDFTFINGKVGLSRMTKAIVLAAVRSAKPKFKEFFDMFWNNEVYFVAAYLDPTSKLDCFSQLLVGSEREHQLQKVERYMKHYLAQCEPQTKQAPLPFSQLQSQPKQNYRVFKIPRLDRREKKPLFRSVEPSVQMLEEWENYKSDSQLSADSITDVLEWWQSRRLTYPNLFPLAVSMIYTQFSTSEMEQKLSIDNKAMHKDRYNFASTDVRRVMILRSRFYNLGLFGKYLETVLPSGADQSSIILSDSSGSSSDEL